MLYRSLHDFEGKDGDISMSKNDVIRVKLPLEDPDEDPGNPQGWLYGNNESNGTFGRFPGNSVQPLNKKKSAYFNGNGL